VWRKKPGNAPVEGQNQLLPRDLLQLGGEPVVLVALVLEVLHGLEVAPLLVYQLS
jgi:hypothetical protein